MRFRCRVTLIAILSMLASRAWSKDAPINDPAAQLSLQKSAPAPHHLNTGLGFSVGLGQYPILAMPLAENSNMRVDGSTIAEDVRINRGSVFSLNLKWENPDATYPMMINGSWSRIASAPGSGLTTPSSYARLNLELGTRFETADGAYSFIPSLETRRSMYQNVDSGHYVDSILLKASIVDTLSNSWQMRVGYGIAPWTRFGLMQSGAANGSGGLAGSSASLREVSVALTYKASLQTDLICSLADEQIKIEMDGSDSYLAYGLPVATGSESRLRKKYSLGVRQINFGAITKF